jgi:hypothetical protein
MDAMMAWLLATRMDDDYDDDVVIDQSNLWKRTDLELWAG